MHFCKTYAELLLTLPKKFRDNAIQYRQLKKLLNKVVHELQVLGLSPEVLHELLETADGSSPTVSGDGHENDTNGSISEDPSADFPQIQLGDDTPFPKVIYEFSTNSDRTVLRLRLWIKDTVHSTALPGWKASKQSHLEQDRDHSDRVEVLSTDSSQLSRTRLLWTLQRRSTPLLPTEENVAVEPEKEWGKMDGTRRENTQELVIPLVTNAAFFELLSKALQANSAYLLAVHDEFISSLKGLSRDISLSARPVSSTSSFHPHSRTTSDPAAIRLPSHSLASSKSDLYSWREIFQLYVEAEVFECVAEASRGARTAEDAESRLALFTERARQRGLCDQRKLKMKESREALETFLQLNILVVNLKKFQHANAEATRKILKKHAKQTALPFLSLSSDINSIQSRYPPEFLLIQKDSDSLPRTLIQAIGEILLPIIPHVDDYSCLICTSIAFKPIRLFCGHLFCVRCLVKMQKRGKGNCPICRAPTVLAANRSNVDWALVNFMQDWFPIEAREKQKENESEAAEEERHELGFRADECVVA